jgi:hypothetical protein
MNGLVLLDTVVVLHFVRGNEIARRIDAALEQFESVAADLGT